MEQKEAIKKEYEETIKYYDQQQKRKAKAI